MNNSLEKIDYFEDPSICISHIGRSLLSKGYEVATPIGRVRIPLRKLEECGGVGILRLEKPIQRKGFLGIKYQEEQRASFIGAVRVKDNKNWNLEVYGRENVSELTDIIKNISESCNAKFNIQLKSEYPKEECIMINAEDI